MNDTIEKISEAPKVEAAVVEVSSEKSSGDNEAVPLTEVSPPVTKSPEPVKVVERTPEAMPVSCDENAKEETAATDVNTPKPLEETDSVVEETPKVEIRSPKPDESTENPTPSPPAVNKTEDSSLEPINVTENNKSHIEDTGNKYDISTKTNGDHEESVNKEIVQEIEELPKYIAALKDIDISPVEISPTTVETTSTVEATSAEETPLIKAESSVQKISPPDEKSLIIVDENCILGKIATTIVEKVPSPLDSPAIDKASIPKDLCTPMDIIVTVNNAVKQKNDTLLPKKVSPEIDTYKIEIKPVGAPAEILSIPKEIVEAKTQPVLDVKIKEKVMDVDMTEVPLIAAAVTKPTEPELIKSEQRPGSKQAPDPTINGETSKDEKPAKRRASEDIDGESPLKKLFLEVEKNFPTHDLMINDYIHTATKNNVDEIQRHTEQLLSEIQTLRTLAQKKEHEWNNILHLKKVKEEILLRLLRRKQVLSFEKAADQNGADRTDPYDYLNPSKSLAIDKSDEISGLAIKQPSSNPIMSPIIQAPMMPVTSQCHFNPMSGLPPPYDKPHLQNMPKFPQTIMMPGPMPVYPRDMNGQLPTSFGLPIGRQGPTKDVKSIIADYRQRNPDITPRRGRRMKSVLNTNMMNPRPIAPKIDPMNSLNNLNMLFNNLDMNQKAMLERLQQMQVNNMANNGLSFKDVLVQYANMQQGGGLIPNRPPETVSRPEHHSRPDRRPSRHERSHEEVHIQPKPQAESSRMASPNPRLPPPPPYPEISLLPVTTSSETTTSVSQQNSLLHGILTKNCGEITITPVQPSQPPEPPQEKPEEVVQLDDEESPTSETSGGASPAECSGRLVIDEGGAAEGGEGGEGGADGGEGGAGAPLCQGCRRRDAQFVCAGCANQWYCSRDCQVAAWDDHSEMCSG